MKSTGNQRETTREVPSGGPLEGSRQAFPKPPRPQPRRPPHSLGASQSIQKLLPRTVRTACTARAALWFPTRVCTAGETGGGAGGRSVTRPPWVPPQPGLRANLVLGAAAALQAGKDLGLHALHPQLPLLRCRGLEVPRLPGEGHQHKLEGLLRLCGDRDICHHQGGRPAATPPSALLPAWLSSSSPPPQPPRPSPRVRSSPQTPLPDHLWRLGKDRVQGLRVPGWHCQEWAWSSEQGASRSRAGCLEKDATGARRRRWERVGEGGCGHHPYMSAAAASFCSSLNPIFLTASAWGSWEPGPSPATLAERGRKDKWMGRGGEVVPTNWDV